MPMTRSRAPIHGLLCAAILVSLAGCSTEAPPTSTSPPEARASSHSAVSDTGDAETKPTSGGARPKSCDDTGTVGLPSGAIGGHNALYRTGEPNMLSIFSLKAESRAWQTDCPVPLSIPDAESSEDCHAIAMLPRPAVLTIKHIANTENYALTIAPPDGQPGITIQRTLQPVLSPVEQRLHVTWLMGVADTAFNADIYVHLRDTTGESGGRPHKNYVVEVFAQGELHCDAHRPHLSTCKSDDFPESQECSGNQGRLTGVQVGIKQTDTGTGNEPPTL